MSIKFPLGTAVKQIVPVIAGTVTDAAIIDGAVHYRVDGTDANGEAFSRFFNEDQIEAVPEPEPETPVASAAAPAAGAAAQTA